MHSRPPIECPASSTGPRVAASRTASSIVENGRFEGEVLGHPDPWPGRSTAVTRGAARGQVFDLCAPHRRGRPDAVDHARPGPPCPRLTVGPALAWRHARDRSAHRRTCPARACATSSNSPCAGPDTIILAVGEPGEVAIAADPRAAADAWREGATRGTRRTAACLPLREAIVAKLARENDLDVDVEQIWVTVGATQALHLAMALTLSRGDEVLVPDPGLHDVHHERPPAPGGAGAVPAAPGARRSSPISRSSRPS